MEQLQASKTVLKREVTRLEGKQCEETLFSEYYDELSAVQDRLEFLLGSLYQKQKEAVSPVVAVAVNSDAKSDVRLPKLTLPEFSGDIHQWLSFRDLFVASVHDNKHLSGAQKLQYLNSALKGEPSLLIQSIAITDANYEVAWNLLVSRYQNKREIVNSTINRLVNQPCVPSRSATGLRKLIDVTSECVRVLKVLDIPVEAWDAILVFHTTDKLDAESRQQWELSLKNAEVPKFEDLTTFLDVRARALAASTVTSSLPMSSKPPPRATDRQVKKNVNSYHTGAETVCLKCRGHHRLHTCQKYQQMSVQERYYFVKSNNLCYNCLQSNCNVGKCTSRTCMVCFRKHHTSLHFSRENPSSTRQVTSHIASKKKSIPLQEVLLSTATVGVRDRHNNVRHFRALLDTGSECTFVTEDCSQQLGLRKKHISVAISGISATGIGTSRSMVDLQFRSKAGNETYTTKAIVVKKITNNLPKQQFTLDQRWTHLHNLDLADPSFNEPGKIDILFGADIVPLLLRPEKVAGPVGTPTAISTSLGWILMGRINVPRNKRAVSSHHASCSDLDATLQRFWEIETVPSVKLYNEEENFCEQHFRNTHERDIDGRYVVRLPFREQSGVLGASRPLAVQRLKQVERQLVKNPQRQQKYAECMQEYLDLGHMFVIPNLELPASQESSCYLPHHSVIKKDSSTTALRIVYDASAKTTTGVSLNDKLLVGPKIQDDIMPLLLRFRTYQIALTSDVVKMFRQVKIHPDDAEYHRIVWRKSPEEEIRDFRLERLTFGTASAPFLATRCLQQLARDEEADFPEAAAITLRDFFVDNLVTGSDTVTQAIALQKQISELLRRGGFELRKWCSNNSEVLNEIPVHLRETNFALDVSINEHIKALGIEWHPASDEFAVSVTQPATHEQLTKRILLSDIAKIFDPLGWISPVTVKAKIFMQTLWQVKLDWDDVLPPELEIAWRSFRAELHTLQDIKVPRRIVSSKPLTCELIGFCDSSERAYAATAYLRSTYSDGSVEVHLVASKTRVTPLKKVTLPRLELCDAVLLIRLLQTIKEALHLNITDMLAFTDSTIVLCWINSSPSNWRTFIANRVAKIHDVLPAVNWFHVCSEENPADLATRGISPSTLLERDIWFFGPQWLRNQSFNPTRTVNAAATAEVEREREKGLLVLQSSVEVQELLVNKYSNLSKLQRVVAWCFRFMHNTKRSVNERQFGPLSARELNHTLLVLVKQAQITAFPTEIKHLKKGNPLPSNNPLLNLTPFLDQEGILRVGGRLHNAQMTIDKKHPILLPREHKLTELIVKHEHLKHLHAGPQLLLAVLQQRFWIIRGRDLIRKIVFKCKECFKEKQLTATQLMGSLPAPRFNPGRVFASTGVDYCGPFSIKSCQLRSSKITKGYVALFVCLATKAIHLEAVNDASTPTFIAALRRFVARRGKPNQIFSDCGTNFVGANRELKKLLQFMRQKEHVQSVSDVTASQGIQWNFNPPGAAHWGGVWEISVKAVKYHLKRVMGSTLLTYEQFITLLTQIEACLNSRPLTELSSDPNDLTALTPGHFLTGDSLLAVPQADFTISTSNCLSKWHLIQKMTQHFWKRWATEYLSRLQQRPKWMEKKENLQIGDLVLLKESTPPQQWKLGRVVKVHPGLDKLVRSVTVRTADGQYRRPIVKLAPLPYSKET